MEERLPTEYMHEKFIADQICLTVRVIDGGAVRPCTSLILLTAVRIVPVSDAVNRQCRLVTSFAIISLSAFDELQSPAKTKQFAVA